MRFEDSHILAYGTVTTQAPKTSPRVAPKRLADMIAVTPQNAGLHFHVLLPWLLSRHALHLLHPSTTITLSSLCFRLLPPFFRSPQVVHPPIFTWVFHRYLVVKSS
jgi:hypothetical protein